MRQVLISFWRQVGTFSGLTFGSRPRRLAHPGPAFLVLVAQLVLLLSDTHFALQVWAPDMPRVSTFWMPATRISLWRLSMWLRLARIPRGPGKAQRHPGRLCHRLAQPRRAWAERVH